MWMRWRSHSIIWYGIIFLSNALKELQKNVQDKEDYLLNTHEYSNIELVNYITPLDAYNRTTFTEETLKMCDSIIKENFILNDEMNKLIKIGTSASEISPRSRIGNNIVEALLPGQLQFVLATNPALPND